MLTENVKTRIRNALPAHLQVPAKYWYGWARGTLEPEMKILRRIVREGDHVVDVGGNRGVYAYELARLGCSVEIFEPNPVCCSVLDSWRRDKPQVKLHAVALSDRAGSAELHIPVDSEGVEHDASASLEHDFSGFRDQTVTTRTLDSYGYEDVSLIKIDVEGHEQSVLVGGARTIGASCPALLIEIEQRHNKESIRGIFTLVESHGYHGFFMDAGRLKPLREFRIDQDQPKERFGLAHARYINNFLFLHRSRVADGHYRDLEVPGT